jgi:hypothetical protein
MAPRPYKTRALPALQWPGVCSSFHPDDSTSSDLTQSDSFQLELSTLTRIFQSTADSIGPSSIEAARVSINKLFAICHLTIDDSATVLSQVPVEDLARFLAKVPSLDLTWSSMLSVLAILARRDQFVQAIWDSGLLNSDRVQYSVLTTLDSVELGNFCFVVYRVLCRIGKAAHRFICRNRGSFVEAFAKVCLGEDLWAMECLEQVILLAGKLAQIPNSLDAHAPALLKVFVRFVHHPEASVSTASVLATAAMLNRTPSLRSQRVFSTEGGPMLFDHLAWLGCQESRQLSEGIAKLFGVMLKRPRTDIVGCRQIAHMIITVLGADRPRTHVLELLRVGVFNEQFRDEELWDPASPRGSLVMETLMKKYPTFALAEKMEAGFVFAGLLSELPPAASRWYLLHQEDDVCSLCDALEELLEIDTKEEAKSPVCPILDALARVIEEAVMNMDEKLKAAPFVKDKLWGITEALSRGVAEENRMTRLIEFIRTRLRDLRPDDDV